MPQLVSTYAKEISSSTIAERQACLPLDVKYQPCKGRAPLWMLRYALQQGGSSSHFVLVDAVPQDNTLSSGLAILVQVAMGERQQLIQGMVGMIHRQALKQGLQNTLQQ